MWFWPYLLASPRLNEEVALRAQEKSKIDLENKSDEEDNTPEGKKNMISPLRKRKTANGVFEEKKRFSIKEDLSKSISPVKSRTTKKLSYPPRKI
jgi:hypothetical protein